MRLQAWCRLGEPERSVGFRSAIVQALPSGGILLAAHLVDPSSLPGGTVCLLRRLSSLPCPGCGMTRAFLLLGHGHVAEAVRMNILSVFAFAIVIALFLDAVLGLFGRRMKIELRPAEARAVYLAAAVCTAASWAYNCWVNPALVAR